MTPRDPAPLTIPPEILGTAARTAFRSGLRVFLWATPSRSGLDWHLIPEGGSMFAAFGLDPLASTYCGFVRPNGTAFPEVGHAF